jgi:hypothetical protein
MSIFEQLDVSPPKRLAVFWNGKTPLVHTKHHEPINALVRDRGDKRWVIFERTDRTVNTAEYTETAEAFFEKCFEENIPILTFPQAVSYYAMRSWSRFVIGALRESVVVPFGTLLKSAADTAGIPTSRDLVYAGYHTPEYAYHESYFFKSSDERFVVRGLEQKEHLTAADVIRFVHSVGPWCSLFPQAFRIAGLAERAPKYLELLARYHGSAKMYVGGTSFGQYAQPYLDQLSSTWRYTPSDGIFSVSTAPGRITAVPYNVPNVEAELAVNYLADVFHIGTPVERLETTKTLPQKARALARLQEHVRKFGGIGDGFYLPKMFFVNPLYENTHKIPTSAMSPTTFVRPCPEVPNHGMKVAGFESEKVPLSKVQERVDEILVSMKEKNVKGAIIVMPYLDAQFSAVLAPNRYVSFAPGHAGVTAGCKEGAFTFPIQNAKLDCIALAGEKDAEAELELLLVGDYTQLVQIRRAPKHHVIGAPPAPDAVLGFAKKRFTVDRIVVVNGLEDLEEVTMEAEARPEGLLVVEPFGAPVSHAAAHCRSYGVAYAACEHDVFQEGDVVTPVSGWLVKGENVEAKAYDPAAYAESFWKGVDYARTHWNIALGRLGIFFHQYMAGPIARPNEVAYLAGAFTGWLAMAGVIAAVGESRHVIRMGCGGVPYSTEYAEIASKALMDITGLSAQSVMERPSVYNRLQKTDLPWEEWMKLGSFCEYVFALPIWPGAAKGSFGGKAWQDSAQAAVEVLRAIVDRNLNEVFGKTNALENKEHNGGHLFNKFITKTFFDVATRRLGIRDFHLMRFILEAAYDVLGDKYKAVTHAVTPLVGIIVDKALENITKNIVEPNILGLPHLFGHLKDFDEIVERVKAANPEKATQVKAEAEKQAATKAAKTPANIATHENELNSLFTTAISPKKFKKKVVVEPAVEPAADSDAKFEPVYKPFFSIPAQTIQQTKGNYDAQL